MQNTSVLKMVAALLQKTIVSNEPLNEKRSFVERAAGTLKESIHDIDAFRDAYLIKKYGQ